MGTALRRANQKFERRFRAMEALAEPAGGLAGKSLDAQDAFWDAVKAAEKRAAEQARLYGVGNGGVVENL